MYDFCKAMVASLTDDQLNSLSCAATSEQRRRLNARVEAGEFPIINGAEIALVGQGCWIQAIKAYRERTGVELLAAKAVIESLR